MRNRSRIFSGKSSIKLVARGRFDDAKDEALASRFAWYEEHVVPSIEELRGLGWTIHEIDGELGMDAVFIKILTALKCGASRALRRLSLPAAV